MEHRRKRQSVDGMIPRRNGEARLGQQPTLPSQFLRPNASVGSQQAELPTPQLVRKPGFSSSELSQSLQELDGEPPKQKKRRFRRLSKKKIATISGILLLLLVGYFGIKILMTSSKLFSGNIFDLLGSGATLKSDQYGRTNILVFGTSEDDPSHADAGANLTDSIMIVSIDQKTKNAAMISVPRDLWVKYGQSCVSGNEGKINVVYSCYGDDGSDDQAGANALMKETGKDFGLDVQYYTHVNYTVVRDAVNAVGGVTVNIDSTDPRGVLDRNFDWTCQYKCYLVKWPNGPAHMNGEQALALARARNDAGGYGLSRGNFDREQNQQKIILALKDKAASAGTLANPVAVSGILDALGKNVRTNFSAGEVKTLIKLAGAIPSTSIRRVSLVDAGTAVMTTGNVGGQSIVKPVAGLYDFSDVQSYVRQNLTFNQTSAEAPKIVVLNGSDYAGVAGTKAAELAAAGLTGVTTGDTDSNSAYGAYVWYDLSGGQKPKTLEKLKAVLGTGPAGTILPSGVQASGDFVIIVGNGAH